MPPKLIHIDPLVPKEASRPQKSCFDPVPKRLPIDRLVKIVHDFECLYDNQLKARRGQLFWEMSRAAPGPPPNSDGWVFCVHPKDGSRQGWIPLTQILYLEESKSSPHVSEISEMSTKSRVLPFMLPGFRRGVVNGELARLPGGSKNKGLAFLFRVDDDAFLSHGRVPFPIGALKKHDLHDVIGSFDAEASPSRLTNEQHTFLFQAEENWTSKTRSKSAGGLIVTKAPSLSDDRPTTVGLRRRRTAVIHKGAVNVAFKTPSRSKLPNVEITSKCRTYAGQQVKTSGDAMSTQSSKLLSNVFGIKATNLATEADLSYAAAALKNTAQAYGRNAYFLPSVRME
jgi:hypothetical protein